MSRFENFRKSEQEIKEEIDEGFEDYLEEKNQEKNEEVEEVFPRLQNTAHFYQSEGTEGASEVYDWYQKAISRRDREPLAEDNFFYHFFGEGSTEPTYMFGDDKKGYILGFLRHDVFIPTHFAPRGLRGGYNLMKELGASNEIPAVMAITDDLLTTLKKMPEWHDTGMTFPMRFRNEIHQKHAVYNSHPEVEQLLPALLQDYLEEASRFNYEDDEEYDQKEEVEEE